MIPVDDASAPPSANLPVGIIGGGYAGLAAAVELARHGLRTVVFERSTTLGGRARCVHADGYLIDNGQHLLLGAYTELLSLLRFLRVSPRVLERRPLTLVTASGELCLTAARLPAPWHLTLGLLRAEGLSWGERLACLRLLQLVKRTAATPLPDEVCTVEDLLAHTRQPERLNSLIWRPLCVSALNTASAHASADTFCHVLRDSLGGPAPASEFLIPRCDLSELLPVPAARYLGSNGGRVHTGCTVKAIAPQPDGSFLLTGLGMADTRVSHTILATAPYHAPALLTPLSPDCAALAARLAALEHRAITTTWFAPNDDWHTPSPLLSLQQGPAHWLFDRAAFGDPHRLWALVTSDAPADTAAETHTTAVWQQLRRELGRPLSPPKWARTITERRATFACLPGIGRPRMATPQPNLYLAGDYLDPRYPATLESAVRSGLAAARTMLASVQVQPHF